MSLLSDRPRVPVAVAENVIDIADGHVDTLRSCALTCHEWLPRAQCHLMASIFIPAMSLDALYSAYDFFSSRPHLARFVRSLSIYTDKSLRSLPQIIPVLFVSRFPNLKRYKVTGESSTISFHPTTFIRIRAHLLLQELCLSDLWFRDGAELAQLILALPRLLRLECTEVRIDDYTDLEVYAGRSRNKCRVLSELTIKRMSVRDKRTVYLLTKISRSTLNVLRLYFSRHELKYIPIDALNLSELEHLRSLHLELGVTSALSGSTWAQVFRSIINLMNAIPVNLPGLTVVITRSGFQLHAIGQDWISHSQLLAKEYQRLEDALLEFNKPRLTLSIPESKLNRLPFWSSILISSFPRLHGDGLLHVQCSTKEAGQKHLGHGAGVVTIAIPPHSRYIATGGEDGTVILWSGTTFPQAIIAEWQCPGAYSPVTSLVFSSCGDFLAAIQESSSDVFVWHVANGYPVRSDIVGRLLDMLPRTSESESGSPDDFAPLKSSYCQTFSILLPHIPTRYGDLPGRSQEVSSLFCRRDFSTSTAVYRVVQSPTGRFVAATTRFPGLWSIWCRMKDLADCEYLPSQLSYSEFEEYMDTPGYAAFGGDEMVFMAYETGDIIWWDILLLPHAQPNPCGYICLRTYLESGCSLQGLYVSPQSSLVIAPCRVPYGPPHPYEHAKTLIMVVLRRTSLAGAQEQLSSYFAPHVVLQGHTGAVRAVSFSPCEQYAASASEDKTVRLWSLRDGSLVWTFRDHHAPVMHVAFSPDGRTLTSADEFGTVIIRLVSMFVSSV